MGADQLFLITLPIYLIALNVSKKGSFTWYISWWGVALSIFFISMINIAQIVKDLK